MAKLMWLGGEGEADRCEWNGHVFPKGEAVDVSDAFMIRKARTNPFFVVDGGDEEVKRAAKADNLAKARAAKAAKRAM